MNAHPIPERLERTRDLITPVMAAASATLGPEMRRVAEFHWGWRDEHGRVIESRSGKALRPALVLLSAEAVGGTTASALRGAAAVEIVHDFTLIHDDVMDEDTERRGRPTVWSQFGVGAAICAGDALMLLAQQVLLADENPYRHLALLELCDATQAVIAGQALDIAYEGRVDIGVDDYLDMASKKTGALLGCSAALGAILGGAETDVVKSLRGFGSSMGLAFQAVDDWLGIWGDPDRVGKPAASDLRQRKASLPIVIAMATPGAAGEAIRRWMTSTEPAGAAGIAAALASLEATDAERLTIQRARRELAGAFVHLDAADIDGESRKQLSELATFVVERSL